MLCQVTGWLSQSKRRADMVVLGLFLLLFTVVNSWIRLSPGFSVYVLMAAVLLLLQSAVYAVSGHRFKWSELIGGVIRILVLVMIAHSILSI